VICWAHDNLGQQTLVVEAALALEEGAILPRRGNQLLARSYLALLRLFYLVF